MSGGRRFASCASRLLFATCTSLCRNRPVAIDGPWTDGGGNCLSGPCPLCPPQCTGDIDLDGDTDGTDLAMLLGDWLATDSPADLDVDGLVDGTDLALLLGRWGVCP